MVAARFCPRGLRCSCIILAQPRNEEAMRSDQHAPRTARMYTREREHQLTGRRGFINFPQPTRRQRPRRRSTMDTAHSSENGICGFAICARESASASFAAVRGGRPRWPLGRGTHPVHIRTWHVSQSQSEALSSRCATVTATTGHLCKAASDYHINGPAKERWKYMRRARKQGRRRRPESDTSRSAVHHSWLWPAAPQSRLH